MDIDNIECVSSSDGVEDDEIHSSVAAHNHHHRKYPLKPQNISNNIAGLVQGIVPATSVHELLECPVCTNSMYPPIHQVCLFFSFFWVVFVLFFVCLLLYVWKCVFMIRICCFDDLSYGVS